MQNLDTETNRLQLVLEYKVNSEVANFKERRTDVGHLCFDCIWMRVLSLS